MTNIMTDSTKPDTTRETVYDDLTQIKGIGEVTQQWLRDAFAIRTYRDLANASPAAIEERLKAEGKISGRSKIHEWVAQARQLASSADAPRRSAEPSKQEEWKALSTFVVIFEERQIRGVAEFQTKAHHMEADNTKAWPGLVKDDLIQWMIAQLGPQALQALTSSAQAPPQPQVPEQARFSGKLSQYVEKAYRLAGEDMSPHLTLRRQTPTQPHSTESPPSPPSTYSGKLQQFITKARHLAGDE